ncbi:unnamed protein product [Candida verbasci]|uniref:Uncharacterized protein n=1 Tax=Candida verbasci TaxID=1227364 RepID=A0A9W4XJ28_9ASCO|nr:unnamed protein product [Candida verbasci]
MIFIYLAGEKYSGQYISKIANAINLISESNTYLDDLNDAKKYCDEIIARIETGGAPIEDYYDGNCTYMLEKLSLATENKSAPENQCYNTSNQIKYKKAKKWQECVNIREFVEDSRHSVDLLPYILSKIRIVFYNGELDIICNTKGVLSYLKKLEWNGKTGFTNDNETTWYYGKENAGYVLKDRNLTFVNVWNVSHMVTFNV